MLQLWQTFVENVDPLTKVIHVPTVRKAIEKAATNISVIPKTFEALLFAMYSAAVMSLNDDECRRVLFQPRKVLLSRYVDETRAALSRIKFMGTTSLVVLQALVLHVLSVRDMYEPRALWALTGVAVRIAQSMGLDRDGEYLNLPPFDTEIRRRVWWQLKTHDFRCAELCGIPKFQDLQTSVESPKWPTNVHDDQLYPDMPSRPTDSDSLTDNIIMAIKGELISFTKGRLASFRGQGNNSGHWDARTTGRDTVEIDRSIKEIENRLESKYIRYCDPSQPLQLMAMLMARCSVNIVRFLSHHPRRWPSIAETALTERHWIWQVSLKVMEQQIMLQSNPQLRQFAWHALYFQNWHILIHILDTLRADPLIADAEKAWRLIGNTYESLPELTQDMRKPIHIAIGNLCLEAYGIREAACTMMNAGRPLLVPDFILHLRRQIISIKNRREGRLRKNSVTKNVANSDQMYPASKGLASDSGVANTQVSRSATKLIDHSLEADRSEDNAVDSGVDSFWNTYEIIDANNGNESEAAGFDLDLILDQDSATKDSGSDAIDWVQWDAWLAESNVLGPFEGEGDLF